VPYCTSDAHMGDAEAFGRNFHGAAVVSAVLHELVTTHGLGTSAPPDRLLFGGLSAGARGAMVHLDYVRSMLPLDEAARQRVEVRGYLDSPLWLDIAPLRLEIEGSSSEAGACSPSARTAPARELPLLAAAAGTPSSAVDAVPARSSALASRRPKA
jgi:hypothetical protein